MSINRRIYAEPLTLIDLEPPLMQINSDAQTLGIPILLRVDSYLSTMGIDLGEARSSFRRRLISNEFDYYGETWRSIFQDIEANGVENSRLGESIRQLLTVSSNAGVAGASADSQSPLAQFAIHPILELFIGNFYFSFTNLAFFMLLTLGFVLLGFFLVTKKGGGKLVPNALQSLVEQIYDFVLNLVN